MERINRQPEEDKDLALQTLSWVVRARRPLLLSELLIALALNPEDNDLEEESIPFDSLIASLTAGLLTMEPTLTGQDKTVRLAHFTVAEYFKDEGSQYLIYTEDHLAETCLNYLLFDNMEPDLPIRQSDQRYGFYDYAANNWGHHIQAASTIDQGSVMRFLRNEAKAKTCCTALNEYLNWPESKALYLTAHFQLEESMRALISGRCDINAATPKGWTLLLSFVERGQEAVVRLLLDNGADISPRATQGNISLREPLAIAAEQGNQTMVRLLLDYGADPNAEVQGGQEIRKERTVPLVNAAKNGHIEIVEMLLGTEGIRINEMVEGRKTAYYWAMVRGHRAVARLLQSCDGTL
jgi:ankyrin repeat protein